LFEGCFVFSAKSLSALSAQLKNLVEAEKPVDRSVAVDRFSVEGNGVFKLRIVNRT